MSELTYARVVQALERLKLTRMIERLDQCAQTADTEGWTYVDFLDRLLEAELGARAERDVLFKTKLAHFPFVKTLDQFDFAAQPSINERQVRELATGRFVAHGENILLLGPPGVGKTHLAIGLGLAVIAHGVRVYFLTMADLVEQLQRDLKQDRVPQRLQLLSKPKLVVVPESWTTPLVGMMMSKEGDTTMNQRRRFTPQFKTRVVLEILTKLKSMAQVCRDYELKEQVVTRWKAEFLERAPTLFAPDQQRDDAQTRIAELERLVGRLTMELEIAKKASQLWDSAGTRNGR